MDSIGSTAGTSAATVDRATRSIQNSIQRTIAVTEAGERGTKSYYEALANQRGANLGVLEPYLRQLDEVTKKQQEAAEQSLLSGQSYGQTSQSVAALTANLRMVPAQLTDIITSLQGGQNPFTVLIQQGGQLVDMFGGVQQAATQLYNYIRTLITPVTVTVAALAAALALVAVAYNDGSKEADAFRRSIVLSGNAAGVTTSQLDAMARAASRSAGTVGANAEALALLVRTGQIGTQELVRYSTTAVQSQKLLGIAVQDTVSAFEDLGKSPLESALKLNEQYNFLTLATYKQIQSLEEQNKTTEAGKVAQKAYADQMDQNATTIKKSLGTLESAWMATGGAAKKAWDFMLDIGRESTVDEKIKKAEKALKDADLARYAYSGGTAAEKNAAKEEAQRQLDSLQNQKKVGEMAAQYAAEETKRRDAAIKFDQEGDKYLSRRATMEKEIVAARNLGQQAAARGEDPAVTEKNIQDRIALIRNGYADLNNASIEAQITNVKRLGEAQEEAARAALIPAQARDEAGLNKALDTRLAYMAQASKAEDAALMRQKANLQQQLALVAQVSAGEDEQAQKAERMAELRAEIGKKDLQLMTNRAALRKELFVAEVQDTRRIFEAQDSLLEAKQADVAALQKQVQAQKDQNAALGLTVQQSQAMTTRIVEENAARVELRASILDTIVGREDEADALRKSAQLMRELNKEQIAGFNKSAAITANKKFWDSVDNAAQTAFTSIFESGKSLSQRLGDALKSGLLDVLYQLTAKKWIMEISTSVSGQSLSADVGKLLGVPGAGATAGNASNASSLLSVGKGVYDAVSSGFAGLATSIGSGLSTAGSLFGSEALAAFGAGIKGGALGSATASAGSGYAGTAAAGYGAAAAPLITAAAGIAAGVLGGRALSGGYAAFGGSGNTAVNAGTAAGAAIGTYLFPVIGTAIGGLLGGLVGGATNRLFGYKSATVESQGIRGTINTSGVSGESYLNTLQKGGLFRSDKRSSTAAALDGVSDDAFDKTVLAMVSAVRGFGKAIGEESTAIDGYTKEFKLALTGDAAKDKELITKLFTDTGDELATRLLPSLAKLTQEGETASAALQRLAGDYLAIDAALGALGLKFGAVGAGSLEARESLLALSGGLEKFVSNAEFYSQNFLSEAERTAAARKQLESAFSDLNITSVPKTRDEFKSLVSGLDLTTLKGRETYAGLMGLQQAFAALTPLIKDESNALAIQKEQRALNIQLMEAMGNAEGALAATRSDALAALLSDEARATQAKIYAAQDAKKIYDLLVGVADAALSRLAASINAEKENINKAYEKQAAAIRDAAKESVKNAQDSLQAAQTQATAIKSVFSALDSALSSTKIESEAASIARRQVAQAVFADAIKKPANLSDNKELSGALATITGQSNERFFGTFEEYARDQARTNNAIASLRETAGEQVDNAQLTVKRLGDAITAIQTASESELLQLQLSNEAQIAALDKTLLIQTSQLDALKGIDSTLLSVSEALIVFAASIKDLKANPIAAGNSNASEISGFYQSLLGRTGTKAEIEFWESIAKQGTSLTEIRDRFLGSTEYQGLKDAPKPIIPSAPAAQVAALLARVADPDQNNVVLLKELQRLNTLTENQQETLDAIAASTGTAGDVLKSAQQGQPLAMEAAR
ncbi:MAG: phage tail length tape measure family protein [Pseudomonadota bacterium]